MSSSPTAHLGSGVNHPGIPRASYFSAYRSDIARRLRRHSPKALALHHIFCDRARYSDNGFNPDQLAIGQCFTGRSDHIECGLSPKEYCTALRLLKKWDIIDTEVRKGVGTIVTIINRGIFDPLSGIEIGQAKAQAFTEGKSQPEGQLKGQPMGQLRDNRRELKGTLTTRNNKGNKEEPWMIIRRLTDQNKAIDERIETIKSDRSNYDRKPGEYQDSLKPEPCAELKRLRTKRKANVEAIANLSSENTS
jgi:hypothetical protein